MEFEKIMEQRLSIRQYDGTKPVTRAQIEELLKAAILAPSWKNFQASRYYVVMEPRLLAQVKEECLPVYNRNNTKDAPVLIVTTFQKSRAGFDAQGNVLTEHGDGWGFYDLGLHNEHLVLKAAELGLGTLIMGMRDSEKLRTLLHIPEEEAVVAVISVGYPADKTITRPTRKQVEEISVFFE